MMLPFKGEVTMAKHVPITVRELRISDVFLTPNTQRNHMRPKYQKKIADIVDNFRPDLLAVPRVFPNMRSTNGTRTLFDSADGGTSLYAWMKLGFTHAPMQILEKAPEKDRAEATRGMNTKRNNWQSVEVFPNLILEGNKRAVAIDQTLRKYGMLVGTPRTEEDKALISISAVDPLYTLHDLGILRETTSLVRCWQETGRVTAAGWLAMGLLAKQNLNKDRLVKILKKYSCKRAIVDMLNEGRLLRQKYQGPNIAKFLGNKYNWGGTQPRFSEAQVDEDHKLFGIASGANG
jgi:hypothetical protein